MNRVIEVVCLECGKAYPTNRHHCPVEMCKPDIHFDWCQRCQQLLIRAFERQFLHVPRRLRIEGE
jgi:hypothetical protein